MTEEIFTGNEGEKITLETASQYTANYRDSDLNVGIKGHFFGKKMLRELLKQRGCVGVRIYYGLDDENNQQLVVVGAKANKNDMLGLIFDKSVPCPNKCSNNNPLNS